MNVTRKTAARIPTDAGEFRLFLYQAEDDDKEHLALTLGEVEGLPEALVRVHSECFTGDVLGSLRCDCGPQLKLAMDRIAAAGAGVILYLRQEGRGIGLIDKLRAYNLQDQGYDTVEANLLLGHEVDERDYSVAAAILRDLRLDQIQLLTNNPAKIEGLAASGVRVARRVALAAPVNRENAAYLQTKINRMRHLLSIDAVPPLPVPNGNGQHRSLPERPYVTLSYAQSLDGSIAVQRGQATAISGPESLAMTHRLRAEHDAILVGIGTVLSDDPQLTTRLVDGPDPQPIILDSQLRFPGTARLLQHPTRRPWLMTTDRASVARQRALEASGARVLRLPADREGRIQLLALLDCLAGLGVRHLMVEGGAAVITSFLHERLVDQLVITVAPRLLGGLNAVGALGSLLPRLRQPRYQWLGNDMILAGEVIWDRA